MRTLSARILVGFAVLILTFGVTTSLVVVYMDQVGDEIRMIRTGFLPLALFSTALVRRQEDLSSYLAEELKDESKASYAVRNLTKYHERRAKALEGVLNTMDGLRDIPERHTRRISETKDRLELLKQAVDATAPLYAQLLKEPPLANNITTVDAQERSRITAPLAQLVAREQQISLKAAELRDYHQQRVTTTAKDLEQTEAGLRTFTIFLGITALLVGLLVTTWATLALRPLRRLRDAARRIASGDYESRIAEQGPLEVADLAREFNVMGRAVSERERERVRSEKLAAVDKMASMIAHEVRNPLSSIGLNVELLEEELERLAGSEPGAADEARALCKSTLHEIHRLNSLTEDYLTLARLPKPSLERKPLAPILRQVADFVREDLSKRKVTLSSTVEAEDATAAVDAEQLWQCLLNLIRNAAEAVAQKGGGHVALRLRREEAAGAAGAASAAAGRKVVIDVSDDGPGIEAELLPRLFDPFFSTKKHGSGLGLALTQEIVRDHGGEITIATELRHGATFSISLPETPPVPAKGKDGAAGDEAGGGGSGSAASSTSLPASVPPAAGLGGPRAPSDSSDSLDVVG